MSVLLFGGYRRILAEGVAIRMPGLHPIGGRATPFTSWGYTPAGRKRLVLSERKSQVYVKSYVLGLVGIPQ